MQYRINYLQFFNMKFSLRAYLGSSALKASTIERLRKLAETDKFEAGRSAVLDAGTGRGSPFAALLQTVDYREAEGRLGIPEEAARLYDVVFSSYYCLVFEAGKPPAVRLPDQAAFRPVEWFEAVETGADLSVLPSRFAAELLRTMPEFGHSHFDRLPDGLRTVIDEIGRLHRIDGTSDAAAASEWKAAREKAMQLTDKYVDEDPIQHVARFAETVAWPVAKAPGEVASAVARWVRSCRLLGAEAAFTPEEQMLRRNAHAAVQRLQDNDVEATREAVIRLAEVQELARNLPPERERESFRMADAAALEAATMLHTLLVGETRRLKE